MTRDERYEYLKYLQEKEQVCGLDKDEVYELNELEDEFGEELNHEQNVSITR